MPDHFPKLSEKEARILACLVDAACPLYAMEIVDLSEGAVGKGTIYVTLARMEEKGFVSFKPGTKPEHGGLPRPLYAPTGLGERAFRAWRASTRAAQLAWQEAP